MTPPTITDSSQAIIDAIGEWLLQTSPSLVVGIDGHGAAGKSTVAQHVAQAIGAALVHTDDFFRPSGFEPQEQDPPMARYYDWQRLREQALEPLLTGATANYRAFDWELDSLLPGVVTVEPADVILVEGVSSTAPALSDLLDRSVLLQTPESERLMRLHRRVALDIWDEAWLDTERRYFATRPAQAFDLVVSGSAAGVA